MTSKELISRIIDRKETPRIGFDFLNPNPCDITKVSIASFVNPYEQYQDWGSYPELLAKVPDFRGEVRMDRMGNIYGRLDQKTQGECIRGALQGEWEDQEPYHFPALDLAAQERLRRINYKDSDKFIVTLPPIGIFSAFRDIRGMDYALMDTILEPDKVSDFLEKVLGVLLQSVEFSHEIGAQAIMIYDDWGTQLAPFISPQAFLELFKPAYKQLADELHQRGLKFIVHSCGYVWDYIPDFIDAGIDVLQFDQPELFGSEKLARTFGKQVTIYSPVDVQKVMATGNRELIEETARHMVEAFWEYAGGALIAKDYPVWEDFDVKPEWTDWARNVFLRYGQCKQ